MALWPLSAIRDRASCAKVYGLLQRPCVDNRKSTLPRISTRLNEIFTGGSQMNAG